jgi:LysM repeat protein
MMKWRDADSPDEGANQAGQGRFDDDEIASFEQQPIHGDSPPNNERPQRRGLMFLLIGFLVVVVALILIVPKLQSSADQKRLIALQARLGALEARMDRFEAIDEKVTRIWEQAQAFEKFKQRFDRGEASMSLRMDHLATSLDVVQKNIEQVARKMSDKVQALQAAKPTPPAAPATARFHVVKKGETLYGIGRQYGLSVKELLRINHIPAGTPIMPGQRLMVKK